MDQLLEYAKSLNSSEEVIHWLKTAGAKSIKTNKTNVSELEHVIDWFNSSDAPKRLQKMSVVDAKRLSSQWMEKNKSKGSKLADSPDDIKKFMKFDDESSIVVLQTKKAFEREGFLMSHCVGGYSVRDGYDIYSLRDKDNNPHATFEVAKSSDNILQVKGKGNGPIHPKYIHRVLEFLKKIGMSIRPSEMINLGYYHIHEKHLEFVKNKVRKGEQVIELSGDFYLI
jgi:hypothetical protein